jgi:hypothetical protein
MLCISLVREQAIGGEHFSNDLGWKPLLQACLPAPVLCLWHRVSSSNSVRLCGSVRRSSFAPYLQVRTLVYRCGLYLGGDRRGCGLEQVSDVCWTSLLQHCFLPRSWESIWMRWIVPGNHARLTGALLGTFKGLTQYHLQHRVFGHSLCGSA